MASGGGGGGRSGRGSTRSSVSSSLVDDDLDGGGGGGTVSGSTIFIDHLDIMQHQQQQHFLNHGDAGLELAGGGDAGEAIDFIPYIPK